MLSGFEKAKLLNEEIAVREVSIIFSMRRNASDIPVFILRSNPDGGRIYFLIYVKSELLKEKHQRRRHGIHLLLGLQHEATIV
jgi:hypothetical protein